MDALHEWIRYDNEPLLTGLAEWSYHLGQMIHPLRRQEHAMAGLCRIMWASRCIVSLTHPDLIGVSRGMMCSVYDLADESPGRRSLSPQAFETYSRDPVVRSLSYEAEQLRTRLKVAPGKRATTPIRESHNRLSFAWPAMHRPGTVVVVDLHAANDADGFVQLDGVMFRARLIMQTMMPTLSLVFCNPRQHEDELDDLLTPRVRSTLDLLLAGVSEKQAAQHMGISLHTVHSHVKTIYRKLNVATRAELLAMFVKKT